MDRASLDRSVVLAIVVSALGYFVDAYDLILFSVVRVPSLHDLGLEGTALLDTGVALLNTQVAGLLIGSLVWGTLGDKRGRLSVLFASIFIYSVANIANGFVHSVELYAVWRFVAGFGLAGEVGAGVTLVSELMDRRSRGYGTTIVATFGVMGVVAAALTGRAVPWRTAYFIGGGMGLVLLGLRLGLAEPRMFKKVVASDVPRGDLLRFVTNKRLAAKYIRVVLIAVPVWYAIGFLLTLSPELGGAMGMPKLPDAARTILWFYVGFTAGDITSGLLSQRLHTRRRVVLGFLVANAVLTVAYFVIGSRSITSFYTVCAMLGFSGGYWAVFLAIASEQFGTNMRAAATVTAPNLVRAALIPMTWLFQAVRSVASITWSAAFVGACVLALALWAAATLEETYGKDLDYVE